MRKRGRKLDKERFTTIHVHKKFNVPNWGRDKSLITRNIQFNKRKELEYREKDFALKEQKIALGNGKLSDVRQYPSKVSSFITKQFGSSSYILVSIFSPSVPENCTIKEVEEGITIPHCGTVDLNTEKILFVSQPEVANGTGPLTPSQSSRRKLVKLLEKAREKKVRKKDDDEK
ncbi:hypothetical protein RhiirA4_444365 [Rhizophagus irregularis]|uniref:Uncharacterized protein n=1 Tax=Rhizophagus irregularis TaxID=588596 RepID=A0A2I1GIN7_9GLOM|nr:hypothetical protein RhiirA4_444365 [Rhizophagus irregularis]